MVKILKRWLPAVIWLILIFYLSHQMDLPSDKVDWVNFVEKKTAHVIEFFILSFLLFRAYRYQRLDMTIFFAVLYAFSDESHQLFIFGRTGRLRDVAIDCFGIFLASLVIIKFPKWFPHTTLHR